MTIPAVLDTRLREAPWRRSRPRPVPLARAATSTPAPEPAAAVTAAPTADPASAGAPWRLTLPLVVLLAGTLACAAGYLLAAIVALRLALGLF